MLITLDVILLTLLLITVLQRADKLQRGLAAMDDYLQEFAVCAPCSLFKPHADATFVSCPLCALHGYDNYFPVVAGSFGELKMHLQQHRFPQVQPMLFCSCMSSALASNCAFSPQIIDWESCTSEMYGCPERRADHLRWKFSKEEGNCSDEWTAEEKEGNGEEHNDTSKQGVSKKKRVTFTLIDTYSAPNPFPVDRDLWYPNQLCGALQRQCGNRALADQLGCCLAILYDCADWRAVSICSHYSVTSNCLTKIFADPHYFRAH